MTTEKLYKIVKRLSSSERKNFTRYVNLMSSKQSLDVVLYQRIIRMEDFDGEKIRGKEFSNSSKFAVYRKRLLEKIVQSKVYFSEFSYSIRLYLIEAAKMGALELVNEKFAAEFTDGLEREDFHYLLYLHSQRNFIADHFLHHIPLQPSWPQSSELLEIVSDVEKYEHLISILRNALTQKGHDKTFQLQRLIVEVGELEERNKIGWDALQKLRVGLELLRGNYGVAFGIQQGLVSFLTDANQSEPSGKIIREISYLIKLGIIVNERDTVIKYTLLLSSLQFQNSLFEEIQIRFWIMDAISVADAYTDFSIVKGTFSTLKESDLGFSDKQKGILLYSISKTSFLSGNHSFAEKVLAYKHQGQKSGSHKHHIFAKLIELMILLEGDDIDRIDSTMDAVKSMNRKLKSTYIAFMVRVIQKISNSPVSEIKPLLVDAEERFLEMQPPHTELIYFNFGLWLRSQIEQSPIKAIIEREFTVKETIAAVGF